MSGVSLDKFQQVQSTENVVIGEDKKEVDKQERGNLFGKLVNWITRSEAQKTSNNEVTKAFFESLEKTYGKEVKDWAIEGYESRLTEGKPLSGYRIEQIVTRARERHSELSEPEALRNKRNLLSENAPFLIDEALKDFDIPEDKRAGWRDTLVELAKSFGKQPGFSNNIDNPEGYREEFQTIVNDLINTHRMALHSVPDLEARRDDLYLHGHDWGGARPEDVEEFAFPTTGKPTYMTAFLQKFGEGDGKTSSIHDYFVDSVLPGAKKRFDQAFGERNEEKLLTYDTAKRGESVHNDVYTLSREGMSRFTQFFRMDGGKEAPLEHELRGEKFHLSVRPEDVERAFETLAPLLTRQDCPLPTWKVVDITKPQQTIDKYTSELKELRENIDVRSQYTDEKLEEEINGRIELIKGAERLRDGCQFTLYLGHGQQGSDPDVAQLLREIENTLIEAGIKPVDHLPESDEPVGNFLSFRVGSKFLNPGDDGYDEALEAKRGQVEDGEPVPKRIDPGDEGYEEFKLSFRDNPHYLGQVGLIVDVHQEEVSRLSRQLGAVGNDRDAFSTVAGEVFRLGEKIGAMNLPDEAKGRLDGAYRLLKNQLDDEIRRQSGVSDRTNELIWNAPIDERSQGFIDRVRTSSFDDLAKARIEQLVGLTAKLVATASSLDTPIEDRLRVAGELESMRLELLDVLNSQRDNVDGDGQELIHGLRGLPFEPNLGNIGGMFQQVNGEDIPEEPGHVSEMFGALGVALRSLDQGLPLIAEEREELDQLVDTIDGFFEFNRPRDGFQEVDTQLKAGLERLRQAIVDQLGAKE